MQCRSRFFVPNRRFVVAFAAAVLAACQTIPDISNWTQSTKDVTAAVTEGFNASARVNREIAHRADPDISKNPAFADPSKRYGVVADALTTRANDYEVLFGALADYSASLGAIAKASANSQETVDAVAGSLNTLVGAAGGTSLAGPAFDLLKQLGSEAIKFKAAHDFGTAVEQADPYIGQISDVLIKDLDDLQKTIGPTKDEPLRAAFEEPHKKDMDYYRALEQRRAALQATIAAAVAPPPSLPGATVMTTTLLSVADAPELAKIDQYIASADDWHAPLQAGLDEALAARATAEELVVQTRRAVEAWRKSHASLASAIKERRLPESGRLAAVAVRIRDLVSDITKKSN